MARRAADCAQLLQVMAGHDTKDSTSVNRPVDDYVTALGESIRGLRIGLPRQYFADGLDADVKARVMDALKVLEGIEEIHITRFHSRDVVRHQLVQKIVEAYEGWDSTQQRLSVEARRERQARQQAAIDANDQASDAQHDDESGS